MSRTVQVQADLLKRAAAFIDEEAECLRRSCTTLAGKFDRIEDKAAYDRMVKLSKELNRARRAKP